MSDPDNPRAGFAMLEALIALTILAASVASLMMLVGMNRWAEAQAEADLSAALNTRMLLNRLGRDLPLEIGTQSGTFDSGEDWSIQISPYRAGYDGGSTQGPHLLQVQIRIRQGKFRPAPIEIFTIRERAR